MSITAILQKFRGRGLKTDAAPQAPRPRDQPTVNNNLDAEESFDTQFEYQEEYKEPKEKTNFFDTNNKKTNPVKEPQRSSSPGSPINVQAVGNVYNIVNASHIQVGHTINLGSSTGAQEQDLEQDEQVDITPTISSLLAAQIKPKAKYLDYVSKNLGRRWRSFFRSIGYNQRQIDTFMEKEGHNVSEVIYQLLLDWKQNTDMSLGALATALWEHGHRCLVRELADIYAKTT